MRQVGGEVDRAFEQLRDRLQPWYREGKKASIRGSIAEMEAGWAASFGDPKDPAVAAKIKEAGEAMLRPPTPPKRAERRPPPKRRDRRRHARH